MKEILSGAAFLLFTISCAQAQLTGTAHQPGSLQGLKGIYLVVELGRDDGLDAAQRPVVLKMLKAYVEAKFVEAGIPLLRYAQEIENAGSPSFEVLVTFDQANGHVFPVVSESRFFQKVRWSRDPSIEMSVVTWTTGGTGDYDLSDLRMLRLQVGGEVDMFIKDYLLVNPKPQ